MQSACQHIGRLGRIIEDHRHHVWGDLFELQMSQAEQRSHAIKSSEESSESVGIAKKQAPRAIA
jgi:hypothetical protein